MINLGYLKILLLLLSAIAIFGSTLKILKEYERAVVFRLGKLHSTKGPGLILLIPLIDRIKKIDLRLVSIDVPRQDIMTKDNVPVTVDAVVYFHIKDPAIAVIKIQEIYQSTFLLAQATLRNILGQADLDDLLSQQAGINQKLQEVISFHSKKWGISIPIVEIKEVSLPEDMKRAMAKQAETERERRAKLIDAQGEYQASQTLAEAGRILSDNPQGFQLRYLQTLRDISTNKGSTILFPFPIDLINPFLDSIKTSLNIQKESEVNKQEKREATKEIKEAPSVLSASFAPSSPSQDLITEYTKKLNEGKLTPQYIQWVLTKKCQFKCSHCEISTKQADTDELTTIEAKKLIDEIAKLNCEFLSITGGEPMMRDDLFEIAQYAKAYGIKLGLTTNGHATEKNLAALADLKFDSVVITLDGYGEVQDRIRNSKDAYNKGIKSIEFFRDICTPKICISITFLDENFRVFPRLIEDSFRAGAHLIQIQPRFFNNGQPIRDTSETVKNAFRRIIEARRYRFAVEAGEQYGYLGPLEPMVRSSQFFCGCGWNTLCIGPDGKIQSCSVLTIPNIEEGDCRSNPLPTIWRNGFAKFRKDIPDDLPDACYKCPYIQACRGGCWLFRAYGLNPCFVHEAEQIFQEITNESL